MSRTDENENPASNVLAASASGTSFLIGIQLASKLFTFSSNQSILRNLSPAVLGVATHLELYMISTLYFSRESIRTAIQRQPLESTSLDKTSRPEDSVNTKNNEGPEDTKQAQCVATQSVVNMSYLSLGIGILLATIFAISYIHFSSEAILQMPFSYSSVFVTGLASLLELGIEPFFVVVQQQMLYKKRAIVETSAAFVKSLTICGTFIWGAWTGRELGVLPFALGYLGNSLMLLFGYSRALLGTASERRFSFLLTRVNSSDDRSLLAARFPRQLVSLSANVFFQSTVKHLLTQGDSMILAAMASLEDQGIYALASNYGGLVARIFLQPIEESSRALFSKLLGSGEAKEHDIDNISLAKFHLVDILQAYGILSVLVFPLAPILVPRILHILGGQRWASSEIDSLMSLYCYYIPFLAFNGITEAFVSSAASPSELRRQAGWMGAFSASFISAAYVFLKIGNLGAGGLVWANIVNMSVRIIWSYHFIQSYFRRYRKGWTLADVCLRPYTCIAGSIATATILANQDWFVTSHGILRTLIFSAAYGLLVLLLERQYLTKQYTKIRQVFKSKVATKTA